MPQTMSPTPIGPFRRVVTSRDSDGRSQVLLDTIARQFGTLHEMWRFGGGDDALVPHPPDSVSGPIHMHPTAGGSVFRFVIIEPESRHDHLTPQEKQDTIRTGFARIGSEGAL